MKQLPHKENNGKSFRKHFTLYTKNNACQLNRRQKTTFIFKIFHTETIEYFNSFLLNERKEANENCIPKMRRGEKCFTRKYVSSNMVLIRVQKTGKH